MIKENGVYIWLTERRPGNGYWQRAAEKLPPFTVAEVRDAMRRKGGLAALYRKVRHGNS